MTQHLSSANTELSPTIKPEQFTQIIDAIIDGKYSWACFLLLRSAGHNPVHYLPYRTYNRLIKKNCQGSKGRQDKTNTIDKSAKTESSSTKSKKQVTQITDLAYLEETKEKELQLQGGHSEQASTPQVSHLTWVFSKIPSFWR